jgi:hypothetical protein
MIYTANLFLYLNTLDESDASLFFISYLLRTGFDLSFGIPNRTSTHLYRRFQHLFATLLPPYGFYVPVSTPCNNCLQTTRDRPSISPIGKTLKQDRQLHVIKNNPGQGLYPIVYLCKKLQAALGRLLIIFSHKAKSDHCLILVELLWNNIFPQPVQFFIF